MSFYINLLSLNFLRVNTPFSKILIRKLGIIFGSYTCCGRWMLVQIFNAKLAMNTARAAFGDPYWRVNASTIVIGMQEQNHLLL